MFNYNDNNIFSGYIKQLLSSFNLPTIRVVKQGIFLNKENYYIYNNKIIKVLKDIDLRNTTTVKLESTDYSIITDFTWGTKQTTNPKNLNFSRKLLITNNYYGTYTHEYLGDYLRFLKDYKQLNLMSLYNCFSNTLVNNLSINYGKDTSNNTLYFKTGQGYKVYKIPIRCFENYTIAIESAVPIELCCGYYGKTQLVDDNVIGISTYQKLNQCQFSKPFLYNKLLTLNLTPEQEKNLYLFIKLPFNNKSSIVVLEGNYCSFNNFIFNTTNNSVGPLLKYNRSVLNFENDNEAIDVALVSNLQLLKLNSGTSYPFADRLPEYLVGHTITNCDAIADNIKRVQVSLQNKFDKNTNMYNSFNYGIWQNKYRFYIYSLANQNNLLDTKQDILGYVDKDISSKLNDDNTNIYNKEN
jgi:hypothetical protein